MPVWEIAISPVHMEAFENFSAGAVEIASLSSLLIANRFSIRNNSFDHKGDGNQEPKWVKNPWKDP